MLSTDRQDFEAQLEVLFGGYPAAFLTAPRKEAYWRGLQKMPLSLFVRCIDCALQDQSEEGRKPPTVNRVWEISRNLRSAAAPQKQALTLQQHDDYHCLGQKWLLAFIVKRAINDKTTLSEQQLQGCVRQKTRIVDQFRAGNDLSEAVVAEWLDVAMTEFERAAA